jgi:hypothetical protein
VSRAERRLLDAGVALTALSGVTYYVMKTWMKPRDPYSVLGHPFQPYALAVHVLAAPVLVFALGLVFREHVLEKWRGGPSVPGRQGGALIVATALPMVLSGYALQAASSSDARTLLSYLHLASGILFSLLFLLHLAGTRARRRAAAGRRVDPLPGVF